MSRHSAQSEFFLAFFFPSFFSYRHFILELCACILLDVGILIFNWPPTVCVKEETGMTWHWSISECLSPYREMLLLLLLLYYKCRLFFFLFFYVFNKQKQNTNNAQVATWYRVRTLLTFMEWLRFFFFKKEILRLFCCCCCCVWPRGLSVSLGGACPVDFFYFSHRARINK